MPPHETESFEPGDWRVQERLCALGLPLEIRAARHFLCSHETFASFADEHPRLGLEQDETLRVELGSLAAHLCGKLARLAGSSSSL